MKQSQKLSRRERDKLRQRQEIFAAALELFAEKGYHNVSVNEIAERAEFAVGTLYKFFDNKESLYKSLMRERADRVHQALSKALEEGDDEIEKLRNYVRTKGSSFKEDAPVVRLYLAETRGVNFNFEDDLHNDIRKQYEKVQQKLAVVFKHGIQKKLFNKIAEPYLLAVTLNSIITGFLFLWLEQPEENMYPENPNTILDILFKGLLADSPNA
ncbi:TetR family transcriptional regulator [Desulfocarbo indianensis]|nr:TetR family transcriptional regulator [Desulfocarbo indianensis]